jgi:hypothetical protein
MTFSKLLLLFTVICVVLIACDDDDDAFNTNPDFQLSFSVDTLSFDTLFTGFGSTTKRFKVYNTSKKKVRIDRISLEDENSPYRMNVNGIEAKNVVDVEIAGKDSIYIFVEVDLLDEDKDEIRLLKDHIQFDLNGKLQKLVLKTQAQDVYQIKEDVRLNSVWTGNRPYVITTDIAIGTGVELRLEEGSRIYFKKDAGLKIHGSFLVNGSFEKPVYFGSTRLEELYRNVPGQWKGIHMTQNAVDIEMKHFVLEDGINGLIIEQETYQNQKAEIEYAIIKNFTGKGLAVNNCDLHAHDLIIANCEQECLDVKGAGSVTLIHSTLYNKWYYSARTSPILSITTDNSSAHYIVNSIVWGSKQNEIHLDTNDEISFQNSLLRIDDDLQTQHSLIFKNCIFNNDPLFVEEEEFDLRIKVDSPAIDKGKKGLSDIYAVDLNGKQRILDEAPDIGAYEYHQTEEE